MDLQFSPHRSKLPPPAHDDLGGSSQSSQPWWRLLRRLARRIACRWTQPCPSDPDAPLGERGEQAAARFLKKIGFKIITQRYRNRFGEIDLIAIDQRTIVFVEVKTWDATRAQIAQQDPAEAVDSVKQAHLARTALTFLKQYHLLEAPARFDVVSIAWDQDDHRSRIRHFINAFSPPGKGQFHC